MSFMFERIRLLIYYANVKYAKQQLNYLHHQLTEIIFITI